MTDRFDEAFEKVIGHEGGYVNNPNDPGGETKYGISKRSYPNIDIPTVTLEWAKDTYRHDFWDSALLGELPYCVAFAVFDAGVNCGMDRAVKWLQTLVGASPDGVVGIRTKNLVGLYRDYELLAAKINAERLMYSANLATWPSFGKGWARRIAANILSI